MRIATTVPTTPVAAADPRSPAATFAELERIGYDTGFSFESTHDPFLPLAMAAEHTSELRLGTAVAIAFARNPMVLANIGHDLAAVTGGRFVMGLGSQIRPHIERRFSETWSRPAARMRELVLAMRAIWARWNDGTPLDFDGEFYRHTLMTPAFDPGPNPHGPPPVFIGGFGPRMIEVAGEVAEGLIVHPFSTRRSLQELVLPSLERGRVASGQPERPVEVVWVTMVVTWSTEEERAHAIESAKGQLAFYASTPAYLPVLELHGLAGLHPELNQLSKEGRWSEMAQLVPDQLLHEVAVVGERTEIAPALVDRLDGITDSVSLVNSRNPDPANFADIARALTALR